MIEAKNRAMAPGIEQKSANFESSGPGALASANLSRSQVVYDTGAGGQSLHAMRDVVDGISNIDLWARIGWRDIKQRYRRSALGPFWVTISMAFMIGTMGLLYGMIFKMELKTYLPYICLGFIFWELISKSIIEGELAFLELEGLIKQIRLPLTMHIVRYVWRNVIVFLHNSVIYVFVALVFLINPGWQGLLLIPGLLLVVLNLIWISLALAVCCARFRDVPMIVTTVLQMLFFVTPVFWTPHVMPSRTVLVHGNPFYHMLEVLREPMLGHAPEAESWIFLLMVLVVGWGCTFMLFTKFRRRIAYWL
jgi:ABC-type polysaccharide/polyol phosphate export permease